MTGGFTRSIWPACLIAAHLCFSGSLLGITTGPAKGVLYIHGGGALNIREVVDLAKQASGKDQPTFCVITTPQGKSRAEDYHRGVPFRMVTTLKQQHGLKEVTELYTLSRKEADSLAFYGLIDTADAVFMSGGNQCFLTDAFLETETLAALQRLLDRGGLIAGSSAGAQVQSSFMTRGDYTKRAILGDKEHQDGFAFIKNAAFDVHVEERNRQNDLLQLFRANKDRLQSKGLKPLDLLGIGIDQGTAIIVTKNVFEVSGKGQVYIFDPKKWQKDPDTWSYHALKPGTFYDMKLRMEIQR